MNYILLINKEKGYTIMKLEKESGLSNGQIGKWKTQKPSYDKVASVANTLNVSLDWLITGKETEDLTQDERKLVDLYRSTNDIGQPLTMKHAEDIQQALPREDQAKGLESSASRIG
jgi:transcriptional regulator with XRE-family HTH domain